MFQLTIGGVRGFNMMELQSIVGERYGPSLTILYQSDGLVEVDLQLGHYDRPICRVIISFCGDS